MSFIRAKLKIACGLLIALTLLARAPAAADPRLDSLIDKFDALKARNIVISKSFWTSYLRFQFSERIPTHLVPNYISAQNAGECEAVQRMDMKTFLLHYPFLEPALSRDDVRESFALHMVQPYSKGFQRCGHIGTIRAAEQKLKQGLIHAAPMRLDPTYHTIDPKIWVYNTDWYDHEGRRNWAIKSLVQLAMCQEYRPALKDVFDFIYDKEILVLAPELEYYALVLAKVLGVRASYIETRIERVNALLEPAWRKRIKAAAMYGDLALAHIPRWHCSGPRAISYYNR